MNNSRFTKGGIVANPPSLGAIPQDNGGEIILKGFVPLLNDDGTRIEMIFPPLPLEARVKKESILFKTILPKNIEMGGSKKSKRNFK